MPLSYYHNDERWAGDYGLTQLQTIKEKTLNSVNENNYIFEKNDNKEKKKVISEIFTK